jgi:hypothetical protein
MPAKSTLPPEAAAVYDLSMEARVAVMEHVALSIDKGFADLRQDIRDLRQELRWLLTLGIAATAVLLGVMAHGFHWF